MGFGASRFSQLNVPSPYILHIYSFTFPSTFNLIIYIYMPPLCFLQIVPQMDWWHKITKTWTALSTRFKHRKSRVSGGRLGGAGEFSDDCVGISGGLLKLRDDVQMCGYRDVEVMWNMLNVSLQHGQIEAARSSGNAKFSKPGCKQKYISRVFFWTNHNSLTNIQ